MRWREPELAGTGRAPWVIDAAMVPYTYCVLLHLMRILVILIHVATHEHGAEVGSSRAPHSEGANVWVICNLYTEDTMIVNSVYQSVVGICRSDRVLTP
jgi:hypothetical protein